MILKLPIFGFVILFSAFAGATGSAKSCATIFNGMSNADFVDKAIESGYKDIDHQVKTFTFGGEKTKVKFLAFVGIDEPPQGSPRDRGTIRLRFKARDLKQAVNLFGQVVDMHLREPPATRGKWPLHWEPKANRGVEVQDYNGEYAEFNNGVLSHTSKWDTRVGIVYSGEPNINAEIDHGWAVDINKPDYSGLDIGDNDFVVTVLTHPGRNESLNSERLFRALFNFGNPE